MLVILSLIFLLLGTYIILIGLSLIDINTQIIGEAVGMIIIAIDAIFFISPIFSYHIITPTRLILRHGIQFRTEISLKNILEIEKIEKSSGLPLVIGIGVKYSMIDKRYSVMRSHNGLIKVRLEKEMILGWSIFPKSVKEFVFDTIDADDLIRRVLDSNSFEADG
jgi:hypothetical protein